MRFLVLAWCTMFGLGLVTPAAAEEPTTLQLASDRWPPFTDDVGKPRFAIELVQTALRRIGVTPQFTIVETAKLEPMVLSGAVDGSAALWQSSKREKVLRYSAAYMENRLILVGRVGTDVSAPFLNALGGQKVGIVGGYAYGDEVGGVAGCTDRRVLRTDCGLSGGVAGEVIGGQVNAPLPKPEPPRRPTYVEGPDDQTNLDRLLAGEVDVILIDELVLRYLLQTSQRAAADQLSIATSPILRAELRFAIRKDHPDVDRILFGFNREIQAMMADGTYNRILRQNWIVADADGDGTREYVLAGTQAGIEPPSGAYVILQGKAPAGSDAAARYRIGNTTYDSWDAIPAGMRRPMDDIAQPTTEPGILIRVGP